MFADLFVLLLESVKEAFGDCKLCELGDGSHC